MSVHDLDRVEPVARAGAAVGRGEWQAALDLLRAVEQERSLTTAEQDLLARAAYGAGQFEEAISAWERVCTESHLLGDDDGAAAAAATVAMYLMMDTGLMAPVRGWLTRAERLLGDRPESPTRALIAVSRTYERFMCGDGAASARWADRAVELGDRLGVPVASALGRVAAARLVILDGEVGRGLDLLDEAAVSVVSGELDPLGTGMVYCELVCAMQGLAQYDRAEQWTGAMERWRAGTAFGGINGRCRVHRAEMLRLRGSCLEAEVEALAACRELRPWMRREFGWPLTELGTIRLRLGDLHGAEEAFLDAHGHGWDPQPGLALLRLAEGDVATALALIADAVEHPCPVPSKEWPPLGALRRAPLLAAQAEIAVAADELGVARRAADELSQIARSYGSAALLAAAALARGRVALAAGDALTAVGECEDALATWNEVGAPYEAAVARLVLGEAERAVGRIARAELEEAAAHAALGRIGARPPSVVRVTTPEVTTSPPLPPVAVPSGAGPSGAGPSGGGPSGAGPPPAGVFRLEGDTRRVGFAGRTVLLQDLKGMRYLARLLAEPDREFHVLDLAGSAPGRRREGDDLGPVLDAQARSAYRRRLAEIAEDIEQAEALGDGARAELARADREYLVRELAGAFGLSGRLRRAGSTSERARASVTRSLRYALARIGEHHPSLADHLRRTVRTGTYCSYAPDPRVAARWEC